MKVMDQTLAKRLRRRTVQVAVVVAADFLPSCSQLIRAHVLGRFSGGFPTPLLVVVHFLRVQGHWTKGRHSYVAHPVVFFVKVVRGTINVLHQGAVGQGLGLLHVSVVVNQ